MKDEEVEIDVGSILMATGHDFFHAEVIPQYNYGVFPNIIESMEFERMCSASGPTGGKILMADGKMPGIGGDHSLRRQPRLSYQ